MYKQNYLISEIVAEVASELDLDLVIEPNFRYVGQITTKDGRKKYFRNSNFDLNSLGASEVAKDKGYTNFFLRQMGYRVPKHDTFFAPKFAKTLKSDKSISAAVFYAQQIGYPVFVKPNALSQGVGVQKVNNEHELTSALQHIFDELKAQVALVEQFITGKDYRIVVVDDTIVAAYQRIPLHIVGDGVSTIHQLLQQKQHNFIQAQRDTIIDFEDPRIAQKLQNTYSMHFDSVPLLGQQIYLLDAANLSTGGEAKDCIPTIHQSYADLAIKATSDMGLRLCGVDIIIDGDISEPEQANYHLIEVNSAPGLDHYAQVGQAQLDAVKQMYRQVILAMIK